MLSERVQRRYPRLVSNIVERVFRVDNPAPKPGLARIIREEQKRAGLRWRDVVSDGYRALRSYG